MAAAWRSCLTDDKYSVVFSTGLRVLRSPARIFFPNRAETSIIRSNRAHSRSYSRNCLEYSSTLSSPGQVDVHSRGRQQDVVQVLKQSHVDSRPLFLRPWDKTLHSFTVHARSQLDERIFKNKLYQGCRTFQKASNGTEGAGSSAHFDMHQRCLEVCRMGVVDTISLGHTVSYGDGRQVYAMLGKE